MRALTVVGALAVALVFPNLGLLKGALILMLSRLWVATHQQLWFAPSLPLHSLKGSPVLLWIWKIEQTWRFRSC